MQFKKEINKCIQLSKYYPPALGGVEIVAEFFSNGLKDLAYDVQVLSFGFDSQCYQGKHGESVFTGKENIKIKSMPVSINYFFNFKKLILDKNVKFVFVHLPNPFAHEVIKFFSEFLKNKDIKVIGIYHSDIVNQVMLRDAYNLYFMKDIEVYDHFISSSPSLIRSSAILSKLNSDKVSVLPFCIEPNYKFIKDTNEFKGKFLTVGRMVPYKGFEFLIDCFNDLPYELTIIGNGPLRHKLESKAKANIRFVGEVSEQEKFELFNSHDSLIVGSINRAEAYGMTIVEAFSVGLPVIASNIDTGVTYLVQDKKTGLVYEILNKEELKDSIKRIAMSKDLRSQLSMNAHQFYKDNLNYQSFKNNLDFILRARL